MIDPKEFFEPAILLHGHRCPAMPLGLRAGAAAMNVLGVERSRDSQLIALVELGTGHFGTCFADGVQMVTGCTFGKGNIRKLHYGKWGLTLIDRAANRAVRVTPKGKAMQVNTKSDFFTKYRSKGIPASEVPSEISGPLVERALNAPVEALLEVGEVFPFEWKEGPHSFEGFLCEVCGEMTVEPYGRILGDKKVCISCRQKATGREEPVPGA